MAITLTPVSSTAKIYIKEAPRALSGPVILFTGDVAHLSLCVYTDALYHEGSMKLSGPAARSIEARRIGYVPVVLDSTFEMDDYYEIRPEHVYPDVLEPVDLRHLNCQPGYNQAFHFTVKDSDRIPVGDSRVTVSFFVAGKKMARTSFTIRKLAARLPEQRCISTAWMHYDGLVAQHNVRPFTREYYKILGSYVDAAVYSGQTMLLVPLFTPAFDTEIGGERRTIQLLGICEGEDGHFTFDFSEMHRFIKFALAHGIKQIEMPPLFTQWGAEHAPKIMVKRPDGRTVRRFGWETDSLSEDYRRFLSDLLPALVAEIRAIGMEEKTFFHVSDEPDKSHRERYAACKELVMPLIGNCRTLDACGDIAFAGKSEREYAVPVEYKLRPFIEAGIRPLCTYFCGNPQGGYYPNRFITQPLARLLVLGASLYRYDIDLFLHWGFNFYNSFLSRREISPYGNTDCDIQYVAGDGFIVYPNYADLCCNPTLRLCAMREMFRLSRILYLLEEKLGRDAVLAILDEEGIVDFGNYPRKTGWMEGFLYRLCDRLA